jgi:copper chaperone CopZ
MAERIAILKVEGMHCQSCASAVGDVLRSERGVRNAKVDFEKKRATVSFDPSQVDEGRIRKVIAGAGYRVA